MDGAERFRAVSQGIQTVRKLVGTVST